MNKKAYNGLAVRFVPIDGASIITESVCVIVTVQYYVQTYGGSECETETYEEGLQEGYSYNWTLEPPPDA